MMFQKAVTFDDMKTAKLIMSESKPLNQKRLGRLVQGFKKQAWDTKCIEVVKRGNITKFEQNQILKEYLLKTYPKVLAESSPQDRTWGIGLPEDSEEAWNIGTWRGKNLLGFILMEVRGQLMVRK